MTPVRLIASLLLTIGTALACTADAREPQAFRVLSPARGTGEVLTLSRPGTSPVRVLGDALRTFAGRFDAALQPVMVVASRDGNTVQGSFVGRRAGKAVRGVAFAHRSGPGVDVALLYDHADRFAASYGPLTEAWVSTIPASQRPEVALQPRRLPDGSGTIATPASWQVHATNAMVSAEGPEGSADLGIWAQVYTPEAAAMFPMQPPLVAPYGNPALAYKIVMSRTLGIAPQAIQVLERAPLSWWPQGPAEMLHVKVQAQGRRLEGLVMVLTSPTGMGQWLFYTSSVGAPEGSFAQNLPTLMRIWASWKVDDRVFQERLRKAAESLRQVNEMIRDVNDNRQAVMDRAARAWDHHIRDTWPVEDLSTGRRADAYGDVNRVVEGLNRAEGAERYRVVPFGELDR